GGDAVISTGDARRPASSLREDFPEGIRGLIVSNEVPDAFGVHKLLLTREGRALAALVLPRIEPGLFKLLRRELADQVERSNARLRSLFGLRQHPRDKYLDAESYALAMRSLAAFPAKKRTALSCKLWFEEAYV